MMPQARAEGQPPVRGSHGCWFSPRVQRGVPNLQAAAASPSRCHRQPRATAMPALFWPQPGSNVPNPTGDQCWWHSICGSRYRSGCGWSLQHVCVPQCPAMPVGLPTVPTVPVVPTALGQTPARAMPAGLCHSRCYQHPQGDRSWDGGSHWGWFAPDTQGTLSWLRGALWGRCQYEGCQWPLEGGGLAGSHVSRSAARPRTGKAPLGPVAAGAGRGIFAP